MSGSYEVLAYGKLALKYVAISYKIDLLVPPFQLHVVKGLKICVINARLLVRFSIFKFN